MEEELRQAKSIYSFSSGSLDCSSPEDGGNITGTTRPPINTINEEDEENEGGGVKEAEEFCRERKQVAKQLQLQQHVDCVCAKETTRKGEN